MKLKYFALICLLISLTCSAVDLQPIPAARRVVDTTNTLTAQQTVDLEKQLYDVKGKAVIATLIVSTTVPEDIFTYSMRVFDEWKLGRKDISNGLLITIAKADRKIRITTGYGLEGDIPDARAKQIISDVIAPKLKANDYYGALSGAIVAIDRLTLPPPEAQASSNDDEILVISITVGIMLLIALWAWFHHRNKLRLEEESLRQRQRQRQRWEEDNMRNIKIDRETEKEIQRHRSGALVAAAVIAAPTRRQSPPTQHTLSESSSTYSPPPASESSYSSPSYSSPSTDYGSISSGGGSSGGGGADGSF